MSVFCNKSSHSSPFGDTFLKTHITDRGVIMSFKSLFIALALAAGMFLGALVLDKSRPTLQTAQPNPQLIKASGKCAECHRNETSSIVHQFESSQHALKGVSCLDCHQVLEGQESKEHRGFTINDEVTAKNCAECHKNEYDQFSRSRHSAPAWAAVYGSSDFTPEQIAQAEKWHPGTVDRSGNPIGKAEGQAAQQVGCAGCHDVGKPNKDGSIGKCTECHGRHKASIELARTPQTCGQCHMGPDHSQIEIYNESKHGALFNAFKHEQNLKADPKNLTTKDMNIPTCATCHMSGLEGMKVTHDVTERLSWWLFAPVSKKRPHYDMGQANMKETCNKCHSSKHTDKFFADAESIVETTNQHITEAKALIDSLHNEGLLTEAPFDETVEFLYFDLWHYFGRTAKHGAFMGGSDFVQWHGNYELMLKMKELQEIARELRSQKKH